jgi:hypothetical protein
MHKYIVVLAFNIDGPDDLGEIMRSMNVKYLPGLIGPVRIAVDPLATQIEDILDNESGIKDD